MFGWLISVLILVLDILAIVKIAGSSASPGMKALWIVIVLVFPLVGLIAWYVAGPK